MKPLKTFDRRAATAHYVIPNCSVIEHSLTKEYCKNSRTVSNFDNHESKVIKSLELYHATINSENKSTERVKVSRKSVGAHYLFVWRLRAGLSVY